MTSAALWYRASGIRRFHILPMTFPDYVGQHSGGVAFLTYYLLHDSAPAEQTLEAVSAALMHDLAEYKTGDIPSPTKKVLDTEYLHKMERNYLREEATDSLLGATLFRHRVIHDIVSLADALDGLVRCALELRSGNRCFESAYENYKEYVVNRIRNLEGGNEWHMAAVNRAHGVVDYAKNVSEGAAL